MKNTKFTQLDVVNARFIFDIESKRVFILAKDPRLSKVTKNIWGKDPASELAILAEKIFNIKRPNCIAGIIDITKDQCISSASFYVADNTKVPKDNIVNDIDATLMTLITDDEFTLCSGQLFDLETGVLTGEDPLPIFIMPKGQEFNRPKNEFIISKEIESHALRTHVKSLSKITNYLLG